MSFGFGVGDILQISGMAWKVYQAYKDAPEQLSIISTEVLSLHHVLKQIEDIPVAGTHWVNNIKPIQHNCGSVLRDCEEFLEKNNRMSWWERLNFANEDLSELRGRMLSCTSSLTAIYSAMVASSQVHISRSQGRIVNSQGQILNSQGHIVNSQGQILDSQGHIVNSQGQILNSQGHIVNSQGQILDSQGHIVNSQGRILDSQGHILRSHAQLVESNARMASDISQLKNLVTSQSRGRESVVSQTAPMPSYTGVNGRGNGDWNHGQSHARMASELYQLKNLVTSQSRGRESVVSQTAPMPSYTGVNGRGNGNWDHGQNWNAQNMTPSLPPYSGSNQVRREKSKDRRCEPLDDEVCCLTCGREFQTRTQLFQHLKAKPSHQVEEEEEESESEEDDCERCLTCGKEFQARTQLLQHLKAKPSHQK